MTEGKAGGEHESSETRDVAAAATVPAAGEPGAASSLVGSVLAGRYRIVEKLGEGAMGAVYLGEHLKIGRMDAIKVLRDSLAADPEAIARFIRGARNVSCVQHPNVCIIYDYSDTDDGHQFWAMEFIPGESLRELLEREGALPLERAVEIARQTAEGLQAAHDAGIVHRDLKPANLMIAPGRDGRDVVKVVDFDIAKAAQEGNDSELTRLGFVIGTPEYMSPEQLTGDRVDGRSDVYALALVLVRMLTGVLPYHAESTQDLMVQRLTGRPLTLEELLPGVHFPAALQAALDRALARRPQDRHANAAEFGREIAAVLAAPESAAAPRAAGTPAPRAAVRPHAGSLPETRLSAPPPVDPASLREEERRHGGARESRRWSLAIAGGILALALVGAASWLALRSEGAREPAEQVGSVTTAGAAPLTQADSGAISPRPPGQTSGATPPTTPGEDRKPLPPPPPPPSTPTGGSAAPAGTAPGVQVQATAPPEPAATAPSRGGVTRENANAVLLRQLDLLDDTPPARVAQAIRDTANLVWDLDGAGTRERSLAAYVLGSAWLASGNAGQCVTWLERALDLRPDGPGFEELLASCRRQRQ